MSAARATATSAPGRSEAAGAWQLLLTLALAGLGFFLPFSTAGVAIFEAALLLLIAARPRAIVQPDAWRHPVMATGLALLAYIALHTLATSGTGRPSVRAINQYQELLLAPLLMALLQRARDRLVFVRALLLGATILALLYWAAMAEPLVKIMVLHERRISAGFVLAVCAFLLLVRAQGHPHAWWLRAAAAFFAITVLFAISSRTGHLLLLVLAGCAAWLHTRGRWRWLAVVAGPLLVITLALGSDAFESRLHETLAGAQPASASGGFTSTTIRLGLVHIAADLARRYAWTGAGYANYAAVHEQAARERYPQLAQPGAGPRPLWMESDNPHSEYVMQLVGGGGLALALFVGWLGAMLWQAARTRRPVSGLLAGLVLAFGLGCALNSMLMDFIEGHLFVGLVACLLAEARDPVRRQERVERVLIIVTRQIGDVLLTTPLLHAARRRWPAARIDVLAFAGTAGMLHGNGDLDRLLEYPPRLGWRGVRSLVRRLWRRYDLALVADPGDRAHLLGWVAAPRRSGLVPSRGGSNWLKRLSLDHLVVSQGDRGELHVAAEKHSLLAPWVRPAPLPALVAPPAAALPADLEQQVTPGAVVVHAPSMWPYKQWPIEHFRALIAGLLAQGRQVVLTGSASARDQECIAPLRELAAPPRLLDVSGRLSFNQLAGLLQQAALYIGPDTSVSHLAAATGVPVIAIFGPTNPLRWAPWPAAAGAHERFARAAPVQQVGNVTVLQGPQACVPCGRAGCDDRRGSRSECLPAITPEQVLAQARRILAPR